MLDQNNNFYLISLSILVTFLLDNVGIFLGRSNMLITFGIYRVNYVDLFEVLVVSSLNRITKCFPDEGLMLGTSAL